MGGRFSACSLRIPYTSPARNEKVRKDERAMHGVYCSNTCTASDISHVVNNASNLIIIDNCCDLLE